MKETNKRYIGELLINRMNSLGLSVEVLSDKSFVDKELLINILNNRVSFDEIAYWDIDFISQCLYCSPEFFINEEERKRDVIYSTGQNNHKVATVMGKLQQFTNDFEFIQSLAIEHSVKSI
jgi:hypothetical protein